MHPVLVPLPDEKEAMMQYSLGHFGMKSRRRTTICNILALFVAMSICSLLLFLGHTSNRLVLLSGYQAQFGTDASSQPIDTANDVGLGGSTEAVTKEQLLDVSPSPETYASEHRGPQVVSVEMKDWCGMGAKSGHDAPLQTAFQSMLNLMPSDMIKPSLLAPFQDTGEEHLMNLASRIRIFKTAFQAWEDLHRVHTHGTIQHRDVIQCLRNAQDPSIDLRASIKSYDAFRSYLIQFGARLFPGVNPDLIPLHNSFYSGGRGIVLTMGNAQVQYVLTSIQSLRGVGCTLPIEVMYLGEDDLGSEFRELLETLPGVVTRDLSTMIDDIGWTVKGWAGKPWAILLSSFREVILMDADVLFFSDPDSLFHDPQYRQNGALFFTDRNLWKRDQRAWVKAVLPAPLSDQVKRNRFWTGESGHMQDSGVVLIDKYRHYIALLLTARLNGIDRDGNPADGKRGVYDMIYGDKETFWLAWEMCDDLDYAFHDGSTGIIGGLRRTAADGTPVTAESENFTVCSYQMVHFDLAEQPLWLNGWLTYNKAARPDDVDISAFELGLREPAGGVQILDKVEAWEMELAGRFCLTGTGIVEITSEVKSVLSMMVGFMKGVSGVY